MLSISQILGIAITLVLILSVGVIAGKNVKSSKDFAIGGGKAAFYMVAGSIIGTLVGGSSTVATSQLAFTNGFSALWFTLGAGIGCLLLGLFFAKPLRKNGSGTLQEMIKKEYGETAGVLSSVLGILGIFLNIVAQLLSAMALLSAILPMNTLLCGLVVALLMTCYILFGGMRGAGAIGVIKTVMLYICAVCCLVIILKTTGGYADLVSSLPEDMNIGLFSRGFGTDGGAACSLILGVLSTQSYAQSILSAKNDRAAVSGSLLSAVLIPPIGIAGVLVGLFIKSRFPQMTASRSFPNFLMDSFPGFVSGVFLAVLLIAIIGTGAGLTLGITSVVKNNILSRLLPDLSEKKKLLCDRIIVVAVLLAAVVFTQGGFQSIILQWSFMSMGLRGAVLFLPLCGALFLPGRIAPKYAVCSIVCGPLLTLLGKLLLPGLPFDPLFLGVAANVLIMAAGLLQGKKQCPPSGQAKGPLF